jgi:DNA polymerase-3 subunit epsilon
VIWPLPWRRATADDGRWVVLDVESTGLDPHHDRLLAIAAIGLRRSGERLWVDLGDTFEVVLENKVAHSDKANILLHGIGVGAQREGVDAFTALEAFAGWADAAPLFGYHVAFDRVLIERAEREHGCPKRRRAWVDLADIAAVIHREANTRALDEWLGSFDIRCVQRHNAAADSLATAELLLRLWPALRQDGAKGWRDLERLARGRQWVAR